ncbi:MAG: hypothetical protein AAF639_41975 [Chloroflexota bacterium]
MNLLSELATFDGKHTDTLADIASRLSPEPFVIDDLCEIAKGDDAKLQSASTWMLKHFQENGVVFSTEQTDALLGLFEYAMHWEAKLHLLQMMPMWVIPAARQDALYAVLTGYLDDRKGKKFVRAWAYNGLAVLADQYPEWRVDVMALLARGREEEAASVKARIRNMHTEFTWVD